jgi:hypothetical protein
MAESVDANDRVPFEAALANQNERLEVSTPELAREEAGPTGANGPEPGGGDLCRRRQ